MVGLATKSATNFMSVYAVHRRKTWTWWRVVPDEDKTSLMLKPFLTRRQPRATQEVAHPVPASAEDPEERDPVAGGLGSGQLRLRKWDSGQLPPPKCTWDPGAVWDKAYHAERPRTLRQWKQGQVPAEA